MPSSYMKRRLPTRTPLSVDADRDAAADLVLGGVGRRQAKAFLRRFLPDGDKADYVEQLQCEGRKVCFVGDGINDAIALKKANVSISLRGATSIATDTAHIVFMEQSLGKLCELRDIARDLERNVCNSWLMILGPNLAGIAGVFTSGFGIGASVVTNNVAALAALANGLLPMRRVAEFEAERRRLLELELKQSGFLPETQALAGVRERH